MGLFSRKQKVAFAVPSLEEQEKMAKSSVDEFLGQITNGWDLTQKGRCKRGTYRIAGLTYHCTFADVGMVRGVTFKDKDNPKDKTAIGLLNVSKKGQNLIGYIAKEDKESFKEFTNDEDNLIFIGYIRKFMSGDKVGICGYIKVYCGDSGRDMYDKMVMDTQVVMGAFNGYYKDVDLKKEGLQLGAILERYF